MGVRWAAVVLLAGCAGGEWVREYEGFLPGTEWERANVFFVRDRRTGRPIAGAHISQHPEDWLDEEGNWAPLWSETRTDEFGLAVLPLAAWPCHWAVSAPGYAPAEGYGGVGPRDEIELCRGEERAGRLLSPDGRPAGGVRVGYKVGCAHSPDLAFATTGTDGVFVLQDVEDGDLTFEDPRFLADYWGGVQERPRRWGIATYQLEPGATIRGRVVKPDGTAPKWAVVWTGSRAPRARTDKAGGFVLRGAHLGGRLLVYWDEGWDKFDRSKYRPGGPMVLRLGKKAEDSEPRYPVSIDARDAAGQPPKKLCRVHLDRLSDGRRYSQEVTIPFEDAVTLHVPAGTYDLSLGGPSTRYRAAPRRITVEGATRVRATFHEQPRLRIEPKPGREEDSSFLDGAELSDPETSYRIQLHDQFWKADPGEPAYLPADAEATLRVEFAGQTLTFAIETAEAGERRVSVRLPGPKVLRFPDLSGPFEAYLLYGWTRLPTWSVGPRWLVVRHPRKGRALRLLELPWEAHEPIDVRGLKFEPIVVGSLRVVDASGRPVPEASIDVYDDLSPPGYDWSETEDQATDADGFYRSALLRNGAWVRVLHFDPQGVGLARWVQLEGAGPYEVRLGSASIEVDLNGYEEAAVLLGSWTTEPYGSGPIVLENLDAGPHTLLIGATGHVTQIHRVVLKHGENRTIVPRLRKR